MRYFVHFLVRLSNSELDERLLEFSPDNLPLIRNLCDTIQKVDRNEFPENWGVFSPYIVTSVKDALRSHYTAAGYTMEELRKIDNLFPAMDNEYVHHILSIDLLRVEELEKLLVNGS